MERKLQKVYPIYYNILTEQDLWHAHYQILPIIFQKEFVELNINPDMMIKKCGTCRNKYKYFHCFLEYINFKDDLKNTTIIIVYFIVTKRCLSL